MLDVLQLTFKRLIEWTKRIWRIGHTIKKVTHLGSSTLTGAKKTDSAHTQDGYW
ncbi:MAG TPA: hypothetical protein VKE71_00780 [Candidatus Angelobacter sp.]|nr:hypothetical protein [Candidatus Angelobacter sp.]